MQHYELEESKYPDSLVGCKITCDRPLTPGRTIQPPFPGQSGFFMTMVAKPGSGKTSLLMKMFSKQRKRTHDIYYKSFKHITYVCPETSRASIDSNPLEGLEDDSKFDNLDYGILQRIQDIKKDYMKDKKPQHQQCLIIDDCAAYLKTRESQEILNEISMNRRHLSCSIILLFQYCHSLPKSIRAQVSHSIIWRPSSGDGSIIREEFLEGMTRPEYNRLVQFVFKDPHDFLFIDRTNQQIYRNLQPIHIRGSK